MKLSPGCRIALVLLAVVLFVILACGPDAGVQKPMPHQSGACQWSTLFCSNEQVEDEISTTLGLEIP